MENSSFELVCGMRKMKNIHFASVFSVNSVLVIWKPRHRHIRIICTEIKDLFKYSNAVMYSNIDTSFSQMNTCFFLENTSAKRS